MNFNSFIDDCVSDSLKERKKSSIINEIEDMNDFVTTKENINDLFFESKQIDDEVQEKLNCAREYKASQKIVDPSIMKSPKEAWEILGSEKLSFIIDIRDQAESIYAGSPDLRDAEKEPINIPFKKYPSMEKNSKFEKTFNQYIFNEDSKVFLMCRDGSTCKEAIEEVKKIHDNCYIIENGFSGDRDFESLRRGTLNGWKANGLPYQEL